MDIISAESVFNRKATVEISQKGSLDRGRIGKPRINFTLLQLEHFLAAVDTGSMTLAAQLLRTSQSNISASVSTLERHLRTKLLVRHRSKGVTTTHEGKILVDGARRLLTLGQEIQYSLTYVNNDLTGQVNVGFFYSMAPFYVPKLLQDIQEIAPGLEVSVREASLHELNRLVESGEIDIALVYDQQLPPHLIFTQMAEVIPYVIVSTDNPLAHRSEVSLHELTGTPMVVYDLPVTMEHGGKIFRELGLPQPPEVHATSFETGRAMVAMGRGFALMNQRTAIDVTSDGLSVVPLEISDSVTPLRIGALTCTGRPAKKVLVVQDLLAKQAILRHPPLEDV